MKRSLLLFIAVVTFGLAGLGFAQGEKKGNKQEEAEARLKEYRHYILQTELGLDDATAAKLFTAIDPYIDKLRDLRLEQRQLNIDIRAEAAKTKPDDKKLDDLLDALGNKELELQTTRVNAFQATKGVLTPVQRTQLLDILPELDRKIREMIKEAKKPPTK